MFAAFFAMVGSNNVYAADDTTTPLAVVAEDYSVVEKNGAVLSSANDVYYSSLVGARASFKVKLSTNSGLVFTNAYYYSRTNQLIKLVDSTTGNQSEVEFDYVLYTNRAEVELTVYYTTTTNSKEQYISLMFSRDNTVPVVADLTINEAGSISYNNYFKKVALTTTATESGVIQSGISGVKYYVVADGVEQDAIVLDTYDVNALNFELEDNKAETAKLCVVVTDKVGLAGEKCSEEFNLDNEGPEIALEPDAKATEVLKTHSVKVSVSDVKANVKSIGYTWVRFDAIKTAAELAAELTTDAMATLEYQPTESENIIYTPSSDNVNETVYVLVVRSEDNLGNISYKYSSQLRVLSTATPYLIGVTDNPEEALSSHSAFFSVNDQSKSKLQEVIYAWAPEAMGYPATFDDLKSAITAGTYEETGIINLTNENKYAITASGLDGRYVLLVGVKTTDNAMVISSIESGISVFVFDTTEPVVIVDPDGNTESSKKSYEVSVTVNEENIANTIYYILLENELPTITADEIKAQGTAMTIDAKLFKISLPVSEEDKLNGTYYFYLLVEDAAGNAVITEKQFLFDNIAPAASVVVEDRFYSNKETVEVKVIDESKVTTYEYAWAKKEGFDLTKVVFSTVSENLIPTEGVAADGEYVLVLKVTDEAGNISDVYVSNTFKFDVSSPVVKGVENNGYYKAAVKVEAEDINSVTLKLNGVEIENGATVDTTGFYKLSVVDALGNETVTYFVVNVDGKVAIGKKNVSVQSQQYAPIICDENGCYIEIARGSYAKDSSIILTTLKDGKYVMLDQDVKHVTVTKDLKSTLAIRKYKLGINDKSVIATTADENGYYGYINVHVVSVDEAVKLGIQTTVIDNEAVTLSLGLAGTFALVGIYFVSRSKKQRI